MRLKWIGLWSSPFTFPTEGQSCLHGPCRLCRICQQPLSDEAIKNSTNVLRASLATPVRNTSPKRAEPREPRDTQPGSATHQFGFRLIFLIPFGPKLTEVMPIPRLGFPRRTLEFPTSIRFTPVLPLSLGLPCACQLRCCAWRRMASCAARSRAGQ